MLIIAFGAYCRYRDLASPGFLVAIPWAISLSVLPFANFRFDRNSIFHIYFVIGIIIFITGYHIFARDTDRLKIYEAEKTKIEIRKNSIFAAFAIETVITIAMILYIIAKMDNTPLENLFHMLSNIRLQGDFLTSEIFPYINTLFISFTVFILYAYLNAENIRMGKAVIIFQIAIGLINAMLTIGRTSLLMLMVFCTIIIIFSKGWKNKRIIIFGSAMMGLFILIFILYNIYKYYGALSNDLTGKLGNNLLFMYVSGSSANFINWADNSRETLLYGKNMFRFIFAVFSALGFDVQVVSLLNPFAYINETLISNTYTVHYFYARDFGLGFALLIQFPIGLLHGYLYKKASQLKPFWIYVFALSIYPLIMQFFQDQYMSLTSAWIQYLLYGLIFFKTGLFLKKCDKFNVIEKADCEHRIQT